MEHGSLRDLPILTTNRLTLRQLSTIDVDEIFLLRSDDVNNQYLDRQRNKTSEDALQFINQIVDGKALYWAITIAGNDRLVGTICLFDMSEDHRKCQIGYELLPKYQKQGIMREAAKEVIRYASDGLKMKAIEASTHKDNLSSTQLLKALNFKNTDMADTDSRRDRSQQLYILYI